MNLTPKQDEFARAYVETGCASTAYRRAYNAQNMKQETIWRKAKECIDNGKVTARIEQLKERVLKKHDCTLDSLIAELEEARAIAIENPRAVSAAVSATMGKAKLLGLVTDKQEHAGKDGAPLFPTVNVNIRRPGS